MTPLPCPSGVTTDTTLGSVRLTITGIRSKESEPAEGKTAVAEVGGVGAGVAGGVTVVVRGLEPSSFPLWQPAASTTASSSAHPCRTEATLPIGFEPWLTTPGWKPWFAL